MNVDNKANIAVSDNDIESAIDCISNLPLSQVKSFCLSLGKRLGFSEQQVEDLVFSNPVAQPVISTGSSDGSQGGSEGASEQTEFDIHINKINPNKKIDVIKALRQINSSYSLKDASGLVKENLENKIAIIIEKRSSDDAKKILKTLSDLGCEAESK